MAALGSERRRPLRRPRPLIRRRRNEKLGSPACSRSGCLGLQLHGAVRQGRGPVLGRVLLLASARARMTSEFGAHFTEKLAGLNHLSQATTGAGMVATRCARPHRHTSAHDRRHLLATLCRERGLVAYRMWCRRGSRQGRVRCDVGVAWIQLRGDVPSRRGARTNSDRCWQRCRKRRQRRRGCRTKIRSPTLTSTRRVPDASSTPRPALQGSSQLHPRAGCSRRALS
jgi:hypothetical protein